jgi:pimeloyl-ACP methyl ester carboxylesterase
MGLFQLRGFAESRLRRHDFALVERLWRTWSPGFRAPADELAAVKAALAPHLPAVLGYYRALLSPASLVAARALLLARTTVPSLYAHGVDDGCVGVELVDGVERAYTGALEILRLDGAGHFLRQERPVEFNRVLLDFLARRSAGDKS